MTMPPDPRRRFPPIYRSFTAGYVHYRVICGRIYIVHGAIWWLPTQWRQGGPLRCLLRYRPKTDDERQQDERQKGWMHP